MSEADAIEKVAAPVTVSSLVADLQDLGLQAGDTVLVHASLSALGWVSGGPPTVVDALMSVLTTDGTLVMPTHTAQYTDPSGWEHPPVPDDWVDPIQESRPPYRPEITPSRGMGAIAECFRTYPAARRSSHPVYSFAAWGAGAEEVVADHGFDNSLGEDSPLARVYDRDGEVLMLGTGHETNTSFHLAEYRAAIDIGTTTHRAPIERQGDRVMVEYEDIEIDAGDFDDLGAAFEAQVGSITGTVGAADARLASQRDLVNFAVEWLEANR